MAGKYFGGPKPPPSDEEYGWKSGIVDPEEAEARRLREQQALVSQGRKQSMSTDADINRQLAALQGTQLHPGPNGLVSSDQVPLTPEQIFEQERQGLDPLTQNIAVHNPYSDTDARTSRANALMAGNAQLARANYANVPGQEDYTVRPEQYEAMGWSPDEQYGYEQDINQGRGATVGLDAQTAALQGYGDIANQGGLTAIDRAAIAQSHAGQEQELRANRQAIMQNAQEQGRAGGNAQMLAQMQASQGTANRRAMDDLQTSALGLQRKDQAIGAMGQLGGQVQSAQDSIDRFNAEGRRTVQQRNIERKNQGIDTKYQDQQQVSRGNTEQANQAEAFNKSSAGGARGRFTDTENANIGIQNANEAQANFELGRQNTIRQEKQQKFENTVGGVTTIANTAKEAAKKVYGL